MANLIPKISLDSLLKNDQSTIKVLSDALENHGFFVLTDHGISNELFKNAYAFSEKFFALDLSKKNALSFVGVFLNTKFEGGRHSKRIKKI